MRLFAIVRSIVSYILIGLTITVLAIPGLILLAMPTHWRYNSRFFYRFVHLCYWLGIKCTFMPIKIVGNKNLLHEPVIIAANHQSALDPLLVGLVCQKTPHVWLAWGQLWNRWSLKFFLKMALPLDVTSPYKAMRSLIKAINILNENHLHAIIFPEGGRFVDGKIHDFYAGFVILVKKTGRPLIPVYIDNAYKVYPPGAFIAFWHPITVTVGEPMIMQEGETDQAFKDRVYQWFVKQSER